MNTQEKVSRLKSLLERIRANAARPRRRFESAVMVTPPGDGGKTNAEELDEELVLLDDDIIEVSESAVPPPAESPVHAARGIDFDDEEEEEKESKPASSRRPIAQQAAAEELDEASAALGDVGHEVPIKTPPPESGPQSATPPPLSSEPAGVHAAEAELASANLMPTVEQLGQTLELEESAGPSLGLAQPAEPEPPPEELEASLAVPASVREPALVPAEPPPASMPASEPAPVGPSEPSPPAPIEPAAVARPAVADAAVVEHVGVSPEFRPASFLELLDASLGLGV